MKLSIQVASTSQTVNVFIQDSSSTTGAGLTGLTFNTPGSPTAYYALPRVAAAAITLATLAAVTSAFSGGGFKEIDATNMPGWYRFDIPDAALASGRFVSIHLKGWTNAAPLPIEIELTAWNNQDAVRGGMTALPNANAEAAGGLYTRGSGAGQIAQQANGQIDANVSTIKTQTVTCAAGVTVLASVGTAVTSTAQTGDSFARIGFAGVNLSNITPLDSSGVTTLVGTRIPGVIQPQTGDSFARLGAPAGANVSADVAAVKADIDAGVALTAAERNATADALLDRANGVEASITLRQAQRVQLAAAAGKVDGAATTTVHLRDQADTKNRVTATVDANGNRTAVTLDLT